MAVTLKMPPTHEASVGARSSTLSGVPPADRTSMKDLLDAYEGRISQLKGFGEEEGIDLRDESREDFWRFVKAGPENRKGDVYLGDNGNLSVAWRDGKKAYLEIEFLGSGSLQCVFFKEHGASAENVCVSESTTLDGLRHLIGKFGLMPLMAGDE